MPRTTRLLVNLPAGFYRTPALRPILVRLDKFAQVRRRSHNTAEEIAGDLAWADAVLMWSWPKLTPELLDRAPQLKFAAHLDLTQQAARVALKRKLPVSHGRAAWSPAVAEMALSLILSTLRKTSDYHAAMRSGRETWVESFPDDIDPLERELAGRPVGIIGFGRIGRRLGELLGPFKCPITIFDPGISKANAKRAGVTKAASLASLIRNVDVIVLCAASNKGSNKLLGKKEIALMRKNTVLINVARSALVDTDALVARLKKRDLFAAVDVFDQEPLPKNHPLRKLPSAYLTPHRAGGVMASVERILNYLIDDLEAFLANRPRKWELTAAMIPALDA